MSRFAFVLTACIVCAHGRSSAAQETASSAALFDSLVASFGYAPSQAIVPQKPEQTVQQPQAATVSVTTDATQTQTRQDATQVLPAEAPKFWHHQVQQSEDFAYIADYDKVTLKFGATWCSPCRSSGPVFEKYANEAYAFSIDVDQRPDLLQKYGNGSSIPQYVVLRHGKVVGRHQGAIYDINGLRQLVSQSAVASK